MKTYLQILALSALPLSAQPTTESPYLFGDWGGLRSGLENQGITVRTHTIFDVYDDFSGAAEDGTGYFWRQRLSADFDLEKMLGWENSYISISGVHQDGKNYNRTVFGVFTNPSSMEGPQDTRLANIYFGQDLLDGALSYKVGKIDGVGEFGVQDYGSTFMNDELSYVPNIIFGAGIPWDPAQKLGAVVTYRPTNGGLYLKGGVYDSSDYDPVQYDSTGLNFDWHGPVAYGAEIGYTSAEGTEKPGFIKLGAHYNTGSFGRYLKDDADNNYLVYLNAGRTLYNLNSDGSRHVDASLSIGHAPEDRNLYKNEITAILRAVGPFNSRPNDEVGLGLIAALISDDYSKASENSGGPKSSEEYTAELTYKAAVTPWLTLQPSFQVVMNPAGNTDRSTVWIAGLRAKISY
ncbi:carbohydrate porin [Coraliomargarita parva]|uniref:carbohydrate porin n=1 Tax=Coraliomargarita parva TaxID=3014050 RepID=UPI0022B5AB34|nr:carbohydrate porin [Coraliomargarita parva]